MARFYIAQSGNNIAPYDTWVKAANSPVTVFALATGGDEVWVKNGIYRIPSTTVPFMPNDGILMYGSFVGNETSIGDRATIASSPFLMAEDIGCTSHTSFWGMRDLHPGNTTVVLNIGAGDWINTIMDGFETRYGYDSILYANGSLQQYTFSTFRNILGRYNAGDIHTQGKSQFLQNILTMNHDSGGMWSLDLSMGSAAYEDITIQGDGVNSFKQGAFTIDVSVGMARNVKIDNIKVDNNSESCAFYCGPNSDVSINNMSITNIHCANPNAGAIITAHYSNFNITDSVIKDIYVNGTTPHGLVFINDDQNIFPPTGKRSIGTFFDCEFSNLGMVGRNAFSVADSGIINFNNSYMDNTAINNSTISNSPIGHYKYHTNSLGSSRKLME